VLILVALLWGASGAVRRLQGKEGVAPDQRSGGSSAPMP